MERTAITIVATFVAAPAFAQSGDVGVGLGIIFFLIACYFLPTFIAAIRGHANCLGILLLNIFLGWTLIGWVGALVWSVLAKPRA
jgi:hypothetical protein